MAQEVVCVQNLILIHPIIIQIHLSLDHSGRVEEPDERLTLASCLH